MRLRAPSTPIDWLIVGLGNPGREYERTRHNVGFMVVDELAQRWDLGRPRDRYRGRLLEGRAGVGGPRVALLTPQTYMNEAGRSVGPARGAYKVPLERVLVVHDEIDLPFGEVRTRVGGGLAGHNGLKSLKRELGSAGLRARARRGRAARFDGPRDRRRVCARALQRAGDGGRRARRRGSRCGRADRPRGRDPARALICEMLSSGDRPRRREGTRAAAGARLDHRRPRL